MQYDVAIYGNEIMDKFILPDGSYIERWGGIWNIARHLCRINKALNVDVIATCSGVAVFDMSSGVMSLKRVEMCQRKRKYSITDAKWSHMSYVNSAPFPKGVKWDSVDVSPSGSSKITIDAGIAFCNSGYNPYSKRSRIGAYIAHSYDGSIMIDHDNRIYRVHHKPKNFAYTIGAGDMLAAEVINAMHLDDKPLNTKLKQCHLNVIKELKNEQTCFASSSSR